MTIRRVPEDFVVRERLRGGVLTPWAGGPAPRGFHAVYELRKTSLATPEAVARLAKALAIAPASIEHAGLKDKHAQTVQHVSVPLAALQHTPSAVPRSASASTVAPPSVLEGAGWSAALVGTIARPLEAADIERNAFEIVVRGLSKADADELLRRATALRVDRPGEPPAIALVNYFGDQRFGSARHGSGFAARRLVEGDFEGALKLLIGTPARKDAGPRRALTRAAAAHWGDWPAALAAAPRCAERGAIERLAAGGSFKDAFAELPHLTQQLAVEAYQSWLWNAAARALAQGAAGDACLLADDDFGPMLFPPAASIPPAWRTLEMPMPAAELAAPGEGSSDVPPWSAALAAVLRAEGLTLDRLRIPGLRRPAFRSVPRPLVVLAERVEIDRPDRDELAPPRSSKPLRLALRFELPRGAYATVALRALGQ